MEFKGKVGPVESSDSSVEATGSGGAREGEEGEAGGSLEVVGSDGREVGFGEEDDVEGEDDREEFGEIGKVFEEFAMKVPGDETKVTASPRFLLSSLPISGIPCLHLLLDPTLSNLEQPPSSNHHDLPLFHHPDLLRDDPSTRLTLLGRLVVSAFETFLQRARLVETEEEVFGVGGFEGEGDGG